MNSTPPFLDLLAPDFSTRSNAVREARSKYWCARTSFGWAVLRHQQAGQLLRDRRLRQGSYAWPDNRKLGGAFAEFWKRSVISLEGDAHKLVRSIAQAALSQSYILGHVSDFEAIAGDLVGELGSRQEFEFVEAFSEPFAGRAIATLMGLDQARAASLAHDASLLGLAMGFNAKEYEATFNAACERLTALAGELLEQGRHHGGETYPARLMQLAADQDGISNQTLLDLLVISIFGGVDTTRAQLAFAVALFAEHQDQWRWLRKNPDMVPQAIDEVIRSRPTTTWVTREPIEDFDFCGVRLKAGETIHILVFATGTDPEVIDCDGFNIRKRRKTHFGFGGGAHHCLGHLVAKTDMAAALRVLLKAWPSFRLIEPAEFLPDSGNTSPTKLHIRINHRTE